MDAMFLKSYFGFKSARMVASYQFCMSEFHCNCIDFAYMLTINGRGHPFSNFMMDDNYFFHFPV